MTDPKEERAYQLANEHWEYIRNVLEKHKEFPHIIELIEFHYKAAAVHFYGHGFEEAGKWTE